MSNLTYDRNDDSLSMKYQNSEHIVMFPKLDLARKELSNAGSLDAL